jgi:hypothetical protein
MPGRSPAPTLEQPMTTNTNDNPPRRTSAPDRPDRKPQAHERLDAQGYRDAAELDPRDGRGQGTERTQAQGRGNDDDRG